MTPSAFSLSDKMALVQGLFSPHIIGDFNDCHVKLARFEGSFTFHKHDDTDELFIPLKGGFTMVFRDREEWVPEGGMIIVERGIEHCAKSDTIVEVLMISKKSSDHTGGIDSPLRKENFPRI